MRRLLVLVVAAVAGCGGAAAPTPQVILVTPDPVSLPTPQVIYVTPDPAAAPTPLIVYVTPEPGAEATPAPAGRIEYSGKGGSRLLDPVTIEAGLYRFDWTVTSPRDDICYLSVDVVTVPGGEDVGGFVSEMSEEGQEIAGSESETLPGGRVAFDVSADGCRAWSLTATPVQ